MKTCVRRYKWLTVSELTRLMRAVRNKKRGFVDPVLDVEEVQGTGFRENTNTMSTDQRHQRKVNGVWTSATLRPTSVDETYFHVTLTYMYNDAKIVTYKGETSAAHR